MYIYPQPAPCRWSQGARWPRIRSGDPTGHVADRFPSLAEADRLAWHTADICRASGHPAVGHLPQRAAGCHHCAVGYSLCDWLGIHDHWCFWHEPGQCGQPAACGWPLYGRVCCLFVHCGRPLVLSAVLLPQTRDIAIAWLLQSEEVSSSWFDGHMIMPGYLYLVQYYILCFVKNCYRLSRSIF